MASYRPVTPSASYNPVPEIDNPSHLSRGYGSSSALNVGVNDFANDHYGSAPDERVGRFEGSFDAPTRGHSVLDGELPQRSASRASRGSTTLNQGSTPSRSGTLKKKSSVKRSGSMKRSGSRRSMHAGSIRGVTIDDQEGGYDREDSVFYTPVPTKGSPTEVLAERFQSMSIAYCIRIGLTFQSLAQVSQGPHHLLPRGLFVVRASSQEPSEGLQRHQQHQCALCASCRRRPERRQSHTARLPQASDRRSEQGSRYRV
jgi:hypothetical protein